MSLLDAATHLVTTYAKPAAVWGLPFVFLLWWGGHVIKRYHEDTKPGGSR